RRADSYILRFYGNADRAERWVAAEAEEWNDRAVEVWGMNYPGFGGSTGPARLSLLGPAALAAFDELKRHATNQPIVVFGASIGATAALHVAANRPAAGLILQNPPPLREIILRRFGWWNLWLLAGPVALQIPRDLDSVSSAKAIRTPANFSCVVLTPESHHKKRSFRRDAETSTRDACATRSVAIFVRCHLSLDFLRWRALRSRAMQNQLNLMSSFEFIAALMSIIIGLGVTNLLAGAGRAFYRRRENSLDQVHIVLTIATLLLLVLQWWFTFKWNTEVNWSFYRF